MPGQPDTIVKARYSRGGAASLRLAKGHVRYAVHRTNEHGDRQYREVWDAAGTLDKQMSYRLLDGVRPEAYVYRLTLSPHPERQDGEQRLDLRTWTRAMMARLEQGTAGRVDWFAVTHAHPDHRHVHVVAVSPERWHSGHFRAMRETGDRQALEQQRQPARDHARDVARDGGLAAGPHQGRLRQSRGSDDRSGASSTPRALDRERDLVRGDRSRG